MSEKLEEKYKYMCDMVEQMATSLRKADEIIERNEELYREKELLKDHIDNICAIIYYQNSLKDQDQFVDRMIEQGFYKKPEDE
jgi:hypothetical protein|tara:strand:+ start:3526 stop:3774 length:249 start_codon:yes stop_codon:yes gene_type:complete